MSEVPLANIELRVLNSDRWGRAFLPVDVLSSVSLDKLAAAFNRTFIEDDDAERLALLERALARAAVTVETYPGETPPQELHVYLRVAEVRKKSNKWSKNTMSNYESRFMGRIYDRLVHDIVCVFDKVVRARRTYIEWTVEESNGAYDSTERRCLLTAFRTKTHALTNSLHKNPALRRAPR